MSSSLVIPIILLLSLINYISCMSIHPERILVTGGAGRTGSLVLQKLLTKSNIFECSAIVRTKQSADKLLKKLKKFGCKQANIIASDITNIDKLTESFKGYDKIILCTSAVPKIKLLSIIKVIFYKVFSFIFKFKTPVRPEFYFIKNGDPYSVDWLGAKNQIDAAVKANIKHFIIVSSMGGTQPENFLNTIGRVDNDDKSGNILLWKRKAEKYLIDSGLKYTIIHPGGLTDKKGGFSTIIKGVDDELLKGKTRQIAREDVAEVCMQALTEPNAINKSIDIVAKPSSDDEKTLTVVNTNWTEFFSGSSTCKYE